MSIFHWLIVLAVVLIIFGTKRLRNAGRDMGEAVKGFKQGMREDEPGQPRPPIEHQTRGDQPVDRDPRYTGDSTRDRNDVP